ncbi:MAG: glutamate racemase [Gammaproteobacteria bacterium]|nr:glutamate racemase [Gammaproteobacteria bacterium]MDE1887599.1 glutamate racemase [Gammaproteobacteria bacterium]MDE2024062.1 glutamate racemase [Gammaproteobacteria bacterium]MDE2140729.1 glutamate racemase [Gammaproteobacteria bacterium]MDE2272881.1 glutamate racemase [Gammaproteobacteria bacterium]
MTRTPSPARERVPLPIGIFDSGVGGLTVLRAIAARLPAEQFLYLGDTARLPYGTKSAESVTRYALQAAAHLVERGIKMLVVACNTASAVAMPALAAEFAPLPVVGVVEAGAEAAVRASHSGHIAVLATESTVRGGAYERAIRARRADARVFSQACSLFVALVEEGWTQGPLVEAVAREYLQPLLTEKTRDGLDCLVLGCTHFPLLRKTILQVTGAEVMLVDSGETVARTIAETLEQRQLACVAGARGRHRFLATDDAERFARVGGRFLGAEIALTDVEQVDL